MNSVQKIMHLEGMFMPSKEVENEYDLLFTMREGTHMVFKCLENDDISDEDIAVVLNMNVEEVLACRKVYESFRHEPFLISKVDVIGTFCEGDILHVSDGLKKRYTIESE